MFASYLRLNRISTAGKCSIWENAWFFAAWPSFLPSSLAVFMEFAKRGDDKAKKAKSILILIALGLISASCVRN